MREAGKIDELLHQLSGDLPEAEKTTSMQMLADAINELLLHHFDQLVYLLYRVDVREKELKTLLAQNKNTDASLLIAGLLLKRQEEKAATRKQFKRDENIPDEDRW